MDPLLTFRKYLQLPKNSLASSGPGTPRGLFNVQQPESFGKVHTSAVDALNMRQLCHRAFHRLHIHGTMEPEQDDTYSECREDTFSSVLGALAGGSATAPSKRTQTADIDPWTWILDDSLWEPRKLKEAHASEVKGRLRGQLRRMFPSHMMPGELEDLLDEANNEEQYIQCIVASRQYLTPQY